MKRKLALLLALVMGFLLMVGCGGGASPGTKKGNETKANGGGESRTFTLAHHLQEASTHHQSFLQFAKEVDEKSGGRLKVNVVGNGTLGSQREVVEAVNLKTIDMAMGEYSLYSNYDDAFGVMNFPFLFNNKEQFFEALDGEVGKRLDQLMEEKTNMMIVAKLYSGVRDVYAVKPMNSLDDLVGLKIRTPESRIFVEFFKALGANPTGIAATEMYTSLQQNVVEAMEGIAETAYNYKIYEVAKNCLLTKHTWNDLSIVINKDIYNDLSKEDQDILTECFDNLQVYQREKYESAVEDYVSKLKDAGVKYAEIDINAAKEKVSSFYEDYVKGNELAKELFEKLKKIASK